MIVLIIFDRMFEILEQYLKGRLSFTDKQFEAIKSLYTPKTIAKGTILLREGEVCQHVIFVTRGCLRSYVVDKNGKEHIVQFAPENWWISDQSSMLNQEPAMYFIDAIQESDILIAERGFQEKFAEIIQAGAPMLQSLLLGSYKAMQKRLIYLLSASAEERYLDFIRTYPTIALHVPQKMIASYLGITPESLSRIRKDIAHQ